MSAADGQRGRLIVVAAPSGAGKTTLVNALLERSPEIAFSVSHTTRQRRPNETDGVDYYFVDDGTFIRMAEAGEFLEHALVFDHRYGTSKAAVDALRARGTTVLLEIDWQGARQVRLAAPDAETVFIVPPGVDVLETRLRGRATDSEAVIARRLRDSLSDLGHWSEFDYVIVNDVLADAIDALAAVVAGNGDNVVLGDSGRIAAALSDTPRQIANVHTFFNVANAVIFVGFTTQIARFVTWLLPDLPEVPKKAMLPKYLNDDLLNNPSVALEAARSEIRRLGKRVRKMVRDVIPDALTGKRADLVVHDLPNRYHLVYRFGTPAVRHVVAAGRVVR